MSKPVTTTATSPIVDASTQTTASQTQAEWEAQWQRERAEYQAWLAGHTPLARFVARGLARKHRLGLGSYLIGYFTRTTRCGLCGVAGETIVHHGGDIGVGLNVSCAYCWGHLMEIDDVREALRVQPREAIESQPPAYRPGQFPFAAPHTIGPAFRSWLRSELRNLADE